MQLLVVALRLEAERIEVGVQMAAHAVGADHHQGPHAVAGRALRDRCSEMPPLGSALALIFSPIALLGVPQLPSSAETISPLASIGQFGAFQEAPRGDSARPRSGRRRGLEEGPPFGIDAAGSRLVAGLQGFE